MKKKHPLPLVSIIIPVYNGEKLLENCIHRLLNQSYPANRIEIVVVDNLSRDNTGKIAESLPVLLCSCSVPGPAAARNTGIKASSGEILLFIDCDCLAHPDLVSNHVKRHQELENNPEDEWIKLVGGGISGLNKNYWSKCDDFASWFNNHPGAAPRLEYFCLPTANLSIKREVFNAVGYFDEELRFGEDLAFCLKALDNKFGIYFDPSASVQHINRTRLKDIISHQKDWGTGDLMLYKKGILEAPGGFAFFLFMLYYPLLIMFEPLVFSLIARRFSILLYAPFVMFSKLVFALKVTGGLLKQKLKNKKSLAKHYQDEG